MCVCVCVFIRITLLLSRNKHNIVNQLYFQKINVREDRGGKRKKVGPSPGPVSKLILWRKFVNHSLRITLNECLLWDGRFLLQPWDSFAGYLTDAWNSQKSWNLGAGSVLALCSSPPPAGLIHGLLLSSATHVCGPRTQASFSDWFLSPRPKATQSTWFLYI